MSEQNKQNVSEEAIPLVTKREFHEMVNTEIRAIDAKHAAAGNYLEIRIARTEASLNFLWWAFGRLVAAVPSQWKFRAIIKPPSSLD